MNRPEIFEKVKHIVETVVDVPNGVSLTESTRLKEDLAADSLDGVDIAVQLDFDFGIDTDDQDIERINNGTLSDIVDLVEESLKKKQSDDKSENKH